VTAGRILRHVAVGLIVAGVALVILFRASGASVFGEENLTLGQILFQSLKQTEELKAITDTTGETVNLVGNLVDTYSRVNAGIDELSHYSVDSFLHDFKDDVYNLYPVLAKIEYGSARLQNWDQTHTSSPFTAYEAISAIAGDLTQPLRDDVKAGRRSIDKELILQTEAAGGFALANVAELSTKNYDQEIAKLRSEYERNPSPGTAAMITAHTNLILAQQNSQLIRLAARTVRLDGVDKSMRASDQLGAVRDTYRRDKASQDLAKDALAPPPMMNFDFGDLR
jgi:hypothetical protein